MKFSVVSLNLWHGELLDQIALFLQEQDPDIILLQEVYNGSDPAMEPRYRSFSVLRERLGYVAADFVAAYADNRPEGKIEAGKAIFSKFPIMARDAVFFDEAYRADYVDIPENYASAPRVLQHVRLGIPGGELDVYNVHGPWDLAGDNPSARRRKMAASIVAAVRGRANVVVAGDTNARPTNPALEPVGQVLDSVFGTELATTFNMRRKDNPGYATAAVDMMYVSRNITVLERACPDVDISDHLPLVARLQF